MDTRFRTIEPRQSYWDNYQAPQAQPQRPNFLQRFNSWAVSLDRDANQSLTYLRNAGRSYQRFSSSFSEIQGNPLSNISGSISSIEKSFQSAAKVRPEAGISRSGSFALGTLRNLANGANAIVGVGDALVALANDYDRGDGRYSEFMSTVPKIVGQSVALGGAGLAAGAIVGAASLPVAATVGLGIAGAWGFGALYDSIFG